uniref:Uncharacterized protein n=1 Tax=Rattus norvegicus TaxID=10116 RepID=A0ABK0LZD7_RAT
MQEPTDYSDMV